MKSQILIFKVRYEDETLKPNYWNWNGLIGCEDCLELLNYGKEETEGEDELSNRN